MSADMNDSINHCGNKDLMHINLIYGICWAHFMCLALNKLRQCPANHRAGYFSNLACDWLSIVFGNFDVSKPHQILPDHDQYACLTLQNIVEEKGLHFKKG